MDRILGLQPVEEFELWLEALASGYSQLAEADSSPEFGSVKANLQFQLQGYNKVIDDLLERSPTVVGEEIKHQTESLTTLSLEGDWLERVRHHKVLGRLMGDFFHLWDFLKRARILGRSLGRKKLTAK